MKLFKKPPKPKKKNKDQNLNSTLNLSTMSGYHSILLKRSILSSSGSRVDLMRSFEAKPRELYTDQIIKNTRNSPSPLSYNVKTPTAKVPFGKMPKAEGFSFLNDSQYRAEITPGPTTYNPKKDVILKRVTGQVKFETNQEHLKKLQMWKDRRNLATSQSVNTRVSNGGGVMNIRNSQNGANPSPLQMLLGRLNTADH